VLRETNFFDYFYFSNFREYFVGNIAIQERKKKKNTKLLKEENCKKKNGNFLVKRTKRTWGEGVRGG